uniref:Uncharacterized protein n=1 Tax=Tanacetum cinerariifolium TaxID=118510 RepID=A0A6L2J2A6_TANCI|nr:hypothetical protein [Tanacetum cinerariifolium]
MKKEGVSSTPSDEFPVLSGIEKNMKNIEGKTNMPKSILKKAVRNIVNDTHEVVKPSHDGESASKVSFEAVGASGDKKKKKKEGVSSTPSDEFLVLSGIAKNVKNIEGKTNVPKTVRNIVNDTHEVVKSSHDGGSASKVSFEAVGAGAKSNKPIVSPFPHSNNDSDDGEVLNELIEYENVGMLRREKAINSFRWG